MFLSLECNFSMPGLTQLTYVAEDLSYIDIRLKKKNNMTKAFKLGGEIVPASFSLRAANDLALVFNSSNLLTVILFVAELSLS